MFSIIVPIFDLFDRLVPSGAIQYALEKVLTLEEDFELIAVNNNPTNSCPQLTQYLRSLKKCHPEKVKLVEPDMNLGTARGFNAGLRVAQPNSEYLVFMSSDADIVDPKMLGKIYHILVDEPHVGIAHPISVYEDGEEYNFSSKYSSKAFVRMIRRQCSLKSTEISHAELQRILDVVSRRNGIKAPLPSFPLTFAVIKRRLINQIGSFDEGVELGCGEDNDLAYRTLLAGFLVARLDGVFVNHRRFLFHNLCARETNSLPHPEAIKQSRDWWKRKWGRPYIELYTRWRFGSFLFTIMLPYFWLRRFASFIKRMLKRFGIW